MMTMLAFAGCQESNPSMTIVSLQIDSDEEDTWIYLYPIPRVKMGNLTILVGGVNETLTSVFSHQKYLSKNEINNISDDEGYFTLYVAADLREVSWEYECKMRITSILEGEEYNYVAEVLIQENDEEVSSTWDLPHNKALEFKE